MPRRDFLATLAANAARARDKEILVGIQVISLASQFHLDPSGTLAFISGAGYRGVEFYGSYYSWTASRAKEHRRLLDAYGLSCLSTHNPPEVLLADRIDKAIDLNLLLGSKCIVVSSAWEAEDVADWCDFARRMNSAATRARRRRLRVGFHNHQVEFSQLERELPMDIIAESTEADITLQLDVGACVASGADPVDWILRHPGRVRSMHIKDWSSGKDHQVSLGNGSVPWTEVLHAAEQHGGVEHYVIECEGERGTRLADVESAPTVLRKLRGL